MQSPGRLIVASNRLPVAAHRLDRGWTLRTSPGGLVTALSAALRRRKGVWVGWPGVAGDADVDDLVAVHAGRLGFGLKPVPLTEQEYERFYHGFSNEVVWPLFHDLPTFCVFDPAYWDAYERVNEKFARSVADAARPGDYVWVHDYHLMNVGRELRTEGNRDHLGFFLHIPFPPRDLFMKLPWRGEVMRSLLEYDLVGFQTPHDLENFLQSVEGLDEAPHTRRDTTSRATIQWADRTVRAGSFPISIDTPGVREAAQSDEVAQRADLVRQRVPDRQFILGVDRLDYTKGIPAKIRAFRRALEQHPELREKVTLLQIVSPSREEIPQYNQLKDEVERLVGEVNGAFYEWGWVPIHYVHRNLPWTELLAWYRLAEVALVTPLRDGMNLVCKEYCASKIQGNGVLVLSEFAGAADELGDGAILVNPFNVDQIARAIHRALTMPAPERVDRMRRLQAVLDRHDVHAWVRAFLAAGGVGPSSTPEAQTPTGTP